MINSKTRLLTICTSFRRPAILPNMLKTFYETKSDGTEILVYLHADDPFLDQYKLFLQSGSELVKNTEFIIGQDPHKCLQEVVNHVVFSVHREIPYYQIVCDDHLYLTVEWDNILIKAYEEKASGWGWVCGDDMINEDWFVWMHPSAEIWSWKFVNEIGYVYPPTIKHRCLDLYTKDLGLAVDGLVFVPEVKIKHIWGAGDVAGSSDINLHETYDDSKYRMGMQALEDWKKNEKGLIVDRVLRAKRKENSEC